MPACLPQAVILPAEPAVSSCLPLVVTVLFFQSPTLAFPAGWSRLAAIAHTHTHKNVGTQYDYVHSTYSLYKLYHSTVKAQSFTGIFLIKLSALN